MAAALEDKNSKIGNNETRDQEALSSIVKDVHTQLREQLHSGKLLHLTLSLVILHLLIS